MRYAKGTSIPIACEFDSDAYGTVRKKKFVSKFNKPPCPGRNRTSAKKPRFTVPVRPKLWVYSQIYSYLRCSAVMRQVTPVRITRFLLPTRGDQTSLLFFGLVIHHLLAAG
jgi:hypothetical protein